MAKKQDPKRIDVPEAWRLAWLNLLDEVLIGPRGKAGPIMRNPAAFVELKAPSWASCTITGQAVKPGAIMYAEPGETGRDMARTGRAVSSEAYHVLMEWHNEIMEQRLADEIAAREAALEALRTTTPEIEPVEADSD